ncbi:MAG: DNA mismatch repair protein MutS [Tannerella sp.]|jgi:DNA mismatch repair ATPase MutS|nr:DNA mismatch repair protein MutS [Tannerella sp.]
MEQKTKTDKIYHFYRAEKDEHSAILCKLKRYIYHIGTARLFLIAGMIATLWLCRNNELTILTAIAAIFMLLFIILVVYHAKLHNERTYEEGYIRLCENELKALDYDFSTFDGAPEHADTQHSFSFDLDLFGENSLFQSVNRTVTQMGREKLIHRFKHPSDDKNDILAYQKGTFEISKMHSFRHKFYVTGEIVSKEKKDIKYLFQEGGNSQKRISDSILLKVMIWSVPAIWALLIAGYIFNMVNISALGIYLIVSFLPANLPAKRIQTLHTLVNKTENILKTYSVLMEQIEKENFSSVILQTYKQNLNPSASSAIKRLSRYIGALDQRFSVLGIMLNLIYMRDTRLAVSIEKWKTEHSGEMKEWFDALGAIDAFCSFGTFAFNHPDYIYPSVSESYFFMEGTGLGHPLLHRDKCVCNDIHIPHGKYFLIITGANMAGKSTYLRTVGVNFLFACMGIPAYAETLTVCPAHLVTSLRTADSLISSESYFFAELKRLKMIIDRLNANERLFIILDEILKGTNSIDKQKGSFSLVKQLIKKETCGIIATHDLLLGTLSEAFPDNIYNRRFEADIKNDELTFTYKIRDGIAQNMNATFLMKKMGISGDDE